MKKTLLVSALALAITSSLVAGTLATYTKTTTPIEATVTAKTFNINRTEVVNPNLKLAPGERSTWAFSVENFENGVVTETDMDLRLKVTLAGEKIIEKLSVSLYDVDNKEYLGTATVKDNVAEIFIPRTFKAGEGKTRHFELRPLFGADGEIQNTHETAVKLEITGEQTPIRHMYMSDSENPGGIVTDDSAVYTPENAKKITLVGNVYYGDATFEKGDNGKYKLTSSTMKDIQYYENIEFDITGNYPNAFKLKSVDESIVIAFDNNRIVE